jgi:peptidyl-prolyl cis-trans isomerase A (cyclophilin A)
MARRILPGIALAARAHPVTLRHLLFRRTPMFRFARLLALVPAVLLVAATARAQEPTAPKGNPVIVLETSLGSIEIELDAEKAPISTANFLAYVDSGHYDNTLFHRVIPGFMIQGGGFDESMTQKRTNAPIKNEADNGLKNVRGTVAMARTNVVDSATSQFFINLKDNDFLNHGGRDFGYAVVGKVTAGMDVVDKIAAVKTGNRGMHQDVPVEPVKITKARRK